MEWKIGVGWGVENNGSRLWQIAFNLKTIQEWSWYLLQRQPKVLWGVLKALSKINFAPLGHLDRMGGGVGGIIQSLPLFRNHFPSNSLFFLAMMSLLICAFASSLKHDTWGVCKYYNSCRNQLAGSVRGAHTLKMRSNSFSVANLCLQASYRHALHATIACSFLI